ncbi:MAG: S1C family serine protease [Candidatus Falkowbacteria bacterium]|nr:S1C family serine protease [Candidatus Falkowbacteria bacterium]
MKKEKIKTIKIKKSSMSSESSEKNMRSAFSTSFVTIVSAALISLVAGTIACLLVIPYFFVPQTGSEVNVSDYNWGNTNLIIRDPKKVVVNQDVKVEESINSVSTSLVKFYPHLLATSTDPLVKKLDAKNYYLLKEPFASGVIMSADGWILALWPGNEKSVDLKKITTSFDIVSSDGKVYSADQAIFAERLGNRSNQEVMPVLVHLLAVNSLPVRSLAKPADLRIGQSIFSYDGGRGIDFGFLIDRRKSELLRSSEDSSESLSLDLNTDVSVHPSFVFNLAGDLLAWQTPSGKVFPVYSLSARLNSLFKLKKISEPFFGVNYYNLSDLRIPGFNQDKGALIYASGKADAVIKGSPAEQAGLKSGDLILEVNGEAINGADDLSAILQNYLPGQDLLVSYSRSGVNSETSVKLGELK